MADIRINQLPEEVSPVASENVAIDSASTRRVTIQRLVDAGAPVASQAEAEAGTNAVKRMTPLTTAQALSAQIGVSIASAAQGALAATAVQPGDLGGAATLDVGTTAGTVAAGNDTRIVNAVQTSRTLTAGTGIATIGDLSANRTIALNAASIASLALADSSVQPARSITAGSGLTGGGNLSADRTIALSAESIASLALADNSAQLSGGLIMEANLRNSLRANVTTVTDWNTAMSSGWYGGFDATNGPTTGGWFVNTITWANGSHLMQTAYPAFTNVSTKIYRRRRSNAGVWDTWEPISQRNDGRAIGNALVYEDFGGFPTLNTDARIILRKPSPTTTDVYNVGILRNAPTGGTSGFVNSGLRVETTVTGDTDSYEWAGLFKLNVSGTGGGEHVALYAQAFKDANNTAWSFCTELRETVSNPTTGSLGIEVGMFVTGTDSSEMRHAIDISIGSANNGTGTNIVSSAIRISPSAGDPARAQLTNGIQIKGRVTAAVDLTQLDVSYSDVTVKMPTNGKLSWRDTNQTVRGELAWNSTVNSWQISGVLNATSATAGGATALPATPAGYMHVQLNGTMRKVPYYAA